MSAALSVEPEFAAPAPVRIAPPEPCARSAPLVPPMAGDPVEYARFLARLTPGIRAACRPYLGNPADVEDVVQDVLITIHMLRHSFDADRPLGPWVATISKRRAIDHVRRERRAARKLVELEEPVSAEPSVEAELDAREAAKRLRSAVASLPRSQRLAVLHAKLRETPLADVAAASGLSVGALKVATHRAMQTLRQRLQADPPVATR